MGTPEIFGQAAQRYERLIAAIPREHLERARIVSRSHVYQGLALNEFMWMAKDDALCCERCDYFYSPTYHLPGGICPKKTGRNYENEVIYCGGKITPHYHFLESPQERLEVYSRAVRWMNDEQPLDDESGRRAHWLIFTYEGALKRRPKILDGVKTDA
jgi:hypothetical protein